MTASVGTGHVTSGPIGSASTPALRILRKCGRLAALLLATAAAALLLIPPDHDDYLAIIGAKVDRLEKIASPRIVFVGGSNLAFGLDSRSVEESLGRPVVNMGMGFNMGLRFMLDLVEPRIGAGDLVVLVPEYNLFFGLLDGDERLIDVLELYPPGREHIHSSRQVRNLVENLPRHARFKVERLLQGIFHPAGDDCVYCPRAFNEYGDNVAHLGLPSKDVAKMDFLRNAARGVDAEAIAVVNAFGKKVADKGARAVMLFPCLPRPHFEQRRGAIEDLHATLGRDLRVPLLSTPLDYVYPVENFYDWVYHLNREGRSRRTAKVIDHLRAVVEASGRARVEASGRTKVEASGLAKVEASGRAKVEAPGRAAVVPPAPTEAVLVAGH